MGPPAPRVPLPDDFRAEPFDIRAGAEAELSRHRMRGADLEAPFRGIRVAVHGELDHEQRCRGYALRMPPRGFFCGVTAARLIGMPLPPWVPDDVLHVAVVSPDRAPRVPGVVGHKLRIAAAQIIDLRGLPISAAPRTWCDLATVLPLADLVAAGDQLVRRSAHAFAVVDLADAVEAHPGRRGRARLIEALELLDVASESPAESRLRVLLVSAGITGFECNAEVVVPGARYRGDFVFRRERVILEYDGDYHRDRDQWRRDMTRSSRLEADGWRIIRVNADDLRGPSELAARIRSVLRARPIR